LTLARLGMGQVVARLAGQRQGFLEGTVEKRDGGIGQVRVSLRRRASGCSRQGPCPRASSQSNRPRLILPWPAARLPVHPKYAKDSFPSGDSLAAVLNRRNALTI